MSGGCMFDGCGKPAERRISSELSGATVPYCTKHYAMARDGFRHIQTPKATEWLMRSGGHGARWYWLGGIMVSEDGRRSR
jgi:hypothetical protein